MSWLPEWSDYTPFGGYEEEEEVVRPKFKGRREKIGPFTEAKDIMDKVPPGAEDMSASALMSILGRKAWNPFASAGRAVGSYGTNVGESVSQALEATVGGASIQDRIDEAVSKTKKQSIIDRNALLTMKELRCCAICDRQKRDLAKKKQKSLMIAESKLKRELSTYHARTRKVRNSRKPRTRCRCIKRDGKRCTRWATNRGRCGTHVNSGARKVF